MKRHRFDALSFTFGMLFVALSLLLWFEGFDLAGSRIQWLGAGALLLFGASMLLSSRKRSRDER